MNNNQNYNDFIAFAKTAEANKQYEKAADWLNRALAEAPNSLEALSMMGSVCVNLKKYDSALKWFEKVVKIAPDVADGWYNLGNAYLFNKNLPAAYEHFKEAERRGVSEDVLPRLYFQLAVLFGMKADILTALYYIGKCEESDMIGNIALSPELLSEKVKLYIASKDPVSAMICAEKLVGVSPKEFTGYMILFSLQMSIRKYRDASNTLIKAKKNVAMSAEHRVEYALAMCNLLKKQAMEPGTTEKEINESVRSAVHVLTTALNEAKTLPLKNKVRITLAELYNEYSDYDSALKVIKDILEVKTVNSAISGNKALDERNMEDYISMLLYESSGWSEDQAPIRLFGDDVDIEDDKNPPVPIPYTFSDPNFMDHMRFVLLSCQIAKKNYEEAEKVAELLKQSTNNHFAYYGIYSSAMCVRMKNPDKKEEWKRAYVEAIAYFKNRMIRNPADSLALVLRARLHAECGNYANAEELAALLSEEDRKSVLDYIDECRNQANLK